MKKGTDTNEKTVHLDLSTLETSKIVMNEWVFVDVKPEHGQKVKIFCMNTDSFTMYIKTKDIYSDIVKDVETKFDTSS